MLLGNKPFLKREDFEICESNIYYVSEGENEMFPMYIAVFKFSIGSQLKLQSFIEVIYLFIFNFSLAPLCTTIVQHPEINYFRTKCYSPGNFRI